MSMFYHKIFYVDESVRPSLAKIGISEFQDFVNYSSGELVSRRSKRPVRTLYMDNAGKKEKYFLKQFRPHLLRLTWKAWSRFQWPQSDIVRELSILQLFHSHGIPVMSAVAWGECRFFCWPISGFLLVEEVVGKEFVDVYRVASLRTRRRLMRAHGELMGTLHHRGIESKVHPRDLICISNDYETYRKCLAVIDRERGLTSLGNISLEQRGKALAEIWIKGAFTIGRGEPSELLAFLSGYFVASGMQKRNKSMWIDLAYWVLRCAGDILDRDERFSNLRQDFNERYGIPQQ